MPSYAAFGLDIRSNLPLPGLIPGEAAAGGSPPLLVHLGSLPPDEGVAPARSELLFVAEPDERGVPSLTVTDAGDHVRFTYADGTCFRVRADGGAVWASWPAPLTLEDAATYLLGPVIAFVLRLRGCFSLHAGVFVHQGGAVAVAGGPEAGKSTLLAALARGGAAVMSDDVAPLVEVEGRLWVQPSYPRVRLWEDSVALLYGAPDSLPPLTPNWEKRYLDVAAEGGFERRPLPLRAVFALAERSARDAPRVEALAPREAVLEVLAQMHSVWMLPKSPQREVFELAARVAEQVPVMRLIPHEDPARLPDLCRVTIAALREGSVVSAR